MALSPYTSLESEKWLPFHTSVLTGWVRGWRNILALAAEDGGKCNDQ